MIDTEYDNQKNIEFLQLVLNILDNFTTDNIQNISLTN